MHTKGPWTWKFYGADDDWVRDAKGEAIVQAGHNQPEREENGRLTAAAPVMQEALRAILELAYAGHPDGREVRLDMIRRYAEAGLK